MIWVPIQLAEMGPWGLLIMLAAMVVVGFATGRILSRAVHLAVIGILQSTNATLDATNKELLKQNSALIEAGYRLSHPAREHADGSTG